MTSVPEQGPGREHPGSRPWCPGYWPQCQPDLLTPPECGPCRGRVWPGAPSQLSHVDTPGGDGAPAGPLPSALPVAQPLFATSPGFRRFLAGFRVETEIQLLRLALQLGAGSPKHSSPVSSVSRAGLFLGKSVLCRTQALRAWGDGGTGRGGGGVFSKRGGSAVFASLCCVSFLAISPEFLPPAS